MWPNSILMRSARARDLCRKPFSLMGARLSYSAVDLKNKVAIITGGNTGIGYETGKAFALMGAHTIIACRSEERGQQVAQYSARISISLSVLC